MCEIIFIFTLGNLDGQRILGWKLFFFRILKTVLSLPALNSDIKKTEATQIPLSDLFFQSVKQVLSSVPL